MMRIEASRPIVKYSVTTVRQKLRVHNLEGNEVVCSAGFKKEANSWRSTEG
jgi:hypothetical protein